MRPFLSKVAGLQRKILRRISAYPELVQTYDSGMIMWAILALENIKSVWYQNR